MTKRAREVVEELRRLATAKDHANLARFSSRGAGGSGRVDGEYSKAGQAAGAEP